MDAGFAEWSKEVVLFCHVTTGIDSDPHQDLLQKKGGRGFPHLVFLDSDGEVLMEHQGARSAEGFKEGARKVKAMKDLRTKAEGGDKRAKFDWAVMRAEGGRLDLEAFEKELSGLAPLAKEQEALCAPLRVNLEVRGVLATITRDRATQVAAGRKFVEMKKAGRIPEGEQEVQPFWILLMGAADDQQDADLFEEGIRALKDRFGGKPGSEGFFDKAEKRLGELKAKGKP